MSVLIIATLDTKAAEAGYLRDRLEAAGVPVLLADAGVRGEPGLEADIPREDFFATIGQRVELLRQRADRGQAITLAAEAAAQLARQLHAQGQLSGVLGLGGSAGTTIASAAMRALPLGVPKVLLSTLASGDVRPYVGQRDVMMLYSVVDLNGLNRVSRVVLNNTANAMIGLVKATPSWDEADADRPLIAATMFGVTTPCVMEAKKPLEAVEYEVLTFHATGIGGLTMEGLIRDGLIRGVLDLTTTELADHLVGGVMSAGPDRLTAAAMGAVPQVISVGAVDMVNFGPPETVPERFQGRKFYQHNPTVTLMRTTPEENDRLGQQIAEKASAARGPTAVLLPLRGVSALDAEGQPFWWPEADQALFQSLRNWAYGFELIEVDAHINDPAFARLAAQTLLRLMAR